MNLIIDFDTNELPKNHMKPSTIGWKAFNLMKNADYLKNLQKQKIKVPKGLIVTSSFYENSIRKVISKYFEKSLIEAISRDSGLIEDIGERLGEEIILDKGDEEKANKLINELINRHGLEKTLKEITLQNGGINFVPRLVAVLSEWLDDIKEEISIIIPDEILNNLTTRLLEFSTDVVYLRSSSYSQTIEEWNEHAGAFGSIPLFISNINKKKIGWIFSSIFFSERALEAVMKSGINVFKMAIFVQPVNNNVLISGTALSSPKDNNYIDLCLEYGDGLTIPINSIKELFKDGVLQGISSEGKAYYLKIDGRECHFDKCNKIDHKKWRIENDIILDIKNQSDSAKGNRNVCITVNVPYKKFEVEPSENSKLPEKMLDDIYQLLEESFNNMNKSNHTILPESWYTKIEFAVTNNNGVDIVQFDFYRVRIDA